jgi:hypothetical protein
MLDMKGKELSMGEDISYKVEVQQTKEVQTFSCISEVEKWISEARKTLSLFGGNPSFKVWKITVREIPFSS